jgi:beta-galactosidase
MTTAWHLLIRTKKTIMLERTENTVMLRKVVICVALLIFLSVPVSAQAPITPFSPSLLLGAAWYPEQWPESRWEADLSLMEAAHIHLVRVGEFAWSSVEPREGDYQLDWLDHAVRAAERHHIAVVIGTPTATPPAWLTAKYPETLRTTDGRKDAMRCGTTSRPISLSSES